MYTAGSVKDAARCSQPSKALLQDLSTYSIRRVEKETLKAIKDDRVRKLIRQ